MVGDRMFDLDPDSRLQFAAKGPFENILQIGGGWCKLKDPTGNTKFTNADRKKTPGVDLVFDILDERWPIEDGVYDMVFASHILEHIPIHKVVGVLQEARRVLRHTGVFVAEVPDIKGVFEECLKGNWGLLEAVYGHDRYDGDQHRWGYLGPDLIVLLQVAGFDRTVLGPGKCYHKAQLPVLRVEATYYGSDNWTSEIEEN